MWRGCRGSKSDLGRAGRGVFPPAQRAEVKALACELPAETGVPLSRWSAAELAREAVKRGIVATVAAITIWRWLREDAIRPWNYRSWIFPRDPKFAEKAGRILDLYEGRWEGQLLEPGDFVVCADEKPSIQARARKHASQPAIPGGRQLSSTSTSARERSATSLPGRPARQAVRSLCTEGGIVPFDQLVEQFMTQAPYSTAQRVFVIVDNAPRTAATVDRPPARRLAEPDPRAHPGARQLGQPGRDLLLRHTAQGAATQQLLRPRHPRRRSIGGADSRTPAPMTASHQPRRRAHTPPAPRDGTNAYEWARTFASRPGQCSRSASWLMNSPR